MRRKAPDSSNIQRATEFCEDINSFHSKLQNVEEHRIEAENFDLELTLTCGQTFCWNRVSGELYGEGPSKFYTFRNGKLLVVEQKGEEIVAETELPKKEVKKALSLHHDIDSIHSTFPQDQKLERAKEELKGLRIIQDEFFPCLISYLCSPQMQIPRIKQMHNEIAKEYGETFEYQGNKLYRFPDLEELSDASEEDLRDLGLGYRAKYVAETMEILQEEGLSISSNYQDAREDLKKLYGVGDKVADCVLLFSLEFLEAYPLDTWALKSAEKHYPELHSEDYDEASENLRYYFGPYSGYAQEYLFHAARKGIIEV
jgi:N-glycosylase/DNA lyase